MSDFLLSQCCSFQTRAIFSYRVVAIERLLAAEKVRLSANGATCIL